MELGTSIMRFFFVYCYFSRWSGKRSPHRGWHGGMGSEEKTALVGTGGVIRRGFYYLCFGSLYRALTPVSSLKASITQALCLALILVLLTIHFALANYLLAANPTFKTAVREHWEPQRKCWSGCATETAEEPGLSLSQHCLMPSLAVQPWTQALLLAQKNDTIVDTKASSYSRQTMLAWHLLICNLLCSQRSGLKFILSLWTRFVD